jgi:hypothetical protein
MRRWVVLLLSSPVLIIGTVGLIAGIGLIVLDLFGAAYAGSPIVVGLVLIGFSTWLMLGRVSSLPILSSPRTPGGGRLQPAKEAALDVKEVERENVAAVGGRGPVAVA